MLRWWIKAHGDEEAGLEEMVETKMTIHLIFQKRNSRAGEKEIERMLS